MAIDYGALFTELDTDPLSFGYSGKTDTEQADLLNVINDSSATITVAAVSPFDMQAAVTASEYDALSASKQRFWIAIVGRDDDIPLGTSINQQVKSIWAPGTNTRDALLDLAGRAGSRAEDLFGENTVVTAQDVAQALGRS